MSQFNGPAANIEDNRKKVSDFSKKTGPESYPSVEAVEKYFLAKQNGVVKVWQPNTTYNVDDYCYASYLNTKTNLYENRVIKCTVSHTSSDYLEDDLDKWSAPPMVVDLAARDLLQRYIHETYATKEEVGNIETALDTIIAEQERIIAIQNALIGGDGQ